MIGHKSTIVIVGCGNLGKRHLESLSKSQNPLDIYLVDNSDKALKECLDDCKDISNKYEYYTTVCNQTTHADYYGARCTDYSKGTATRTKLQDLDTSSQIQQDPDPSRPIENIEKPSKYIEI